MKILVAIALRQEIRLFTRALKSAGFESSEEENQFKKGDCEIIILEIGVGKVRAAITLQSYLVVMPKPDLILSVGLAGSLSEKYHQGDVVEIGKIVQGDVPSDWSEDLFSKDGGDAQTLITSDQFIDYVKGKELLKKFGEGIVDMEGYAIAYCAHTHKVPVRLIKVVSDEVLKEDKSGLASFTKFMTSVECYEGFREAVNRI